jgi:hypothetical protein
MTLYVARLENLTAGLLTNDSGKIIRVAPVFQWSRNLPIKAFQIWIEGKGGELAEVKENANATTEGKKQESNFQKH